MRAWAFIAVVVLVAALAFALGTLVRSPDAAILSARDQSVPVFSAVESRSVTAAVRIQGEVVGSPIYPIYAQLPDGAQRAVVTSVAVAPGASLPNGALLGTVSDRPTFVFALRVPLFRDIQRGDTGSDVAALQEALGVRTSALMGSDTLDAVRALYRTANIVPPGGAGYGTYVSLKEFASLPASQGPPVVRTVAAPGAILAAETPFAELGLGSSYGSVRASVSEADRVTVGGAAVIQKAGGAPVTATVTSVGEFQSTATASGRPPGRDIRIDFPPESGLATGQLISVLFGSEVAPERAVPTLALRSDSGGEYVLRRTNVGTSQRLTERVAVSVLRNANGWSAVDSNELRVGDEVLISP